MPRRRNFTRATCTVCRREVWAWDDGLGISTWDLEYYDSTFHLISHPCWSDDAEDLAHYRIRNGDLQ